MVVNTSAPAFVLDGKGEMFKEKLNRNNPMMLQVLKPESTTWTVFDAEPPEHFLLTAWVRFILFLNMSDDKFGK